MDKLLLLWSRVTEILNPIGDWVALLPLRLLLAWEFWEAGVMKLGGNNWFGGIKENFPFPFNYVPVDLSWFIATWFELLGGIGLAIGLFTRFWAISLVILSVVAIFGVHWPDDWSSLSELWKGYAISNKGFGNFKLPLLFIVMLLPLFFSGPGKASVDHILSKKFADK